MRRKSTGLEPIIGKVSEMLLALHTSRYLGLPDCSRIYLPSLWWRLVALVNTLASTLLRGRVNAKPLRSIVAVEYRLDNRTVIAIDRRTVPLLPPANEAIIRNTPCLAASAKSWARTSAVYEQKNSGERADADCLGKLASAQASQARTLTVHDADVDADYDLTLGYLDRLRMRSVRVVNPRGWHRSLEIIKGLRRSFHPRILQLDDKTPSHMIAH